MSGAGNDNPSLRHVPVLIVGGGPAGLATAIRLKTLSPATPVVVLDKGPGPGCHTLSGAVLEPEPLHELLDEVDPDWAGSEQARSVLARRVERDDILMLPCSWGALPIKPLLRLARLFRLGFGDMLHGGDFSLSVSELTRWFADIARGLGVELLYGFSVAEVLLSDDKRWAIGVRTQEQGLDRDSRAQRNYQPGEVLTAEVIVLAEGCDGYVTEQLVADAGLIRRRHQLWSVGVKEIIEVSDEQYARFGAGRVVHAMGYPLWRPMLGPGMFGGGIMYACGGNRLAVGMIVGADWKYRDFNPQEALERFKGHRFVRSMIEGGKVIEAGAKMIPEGGWDAIPRDPETQAFGLENVVLVGDGAGFVNMQKIKGLHNALRTGMMAAEAIADLSDRPRQVAGLYTHMVRSSPVGWEMRRARNFRQTVARFGNLLGMPLSVLGNLLPKFQPEQDYTRMTRASYRYRLDRSFDKESFVARGGVEHREDQPCHCEVLDPSICQSRCLPEYGQPCIRFCPAGVYEHIDGRMVPANPSNCLHCKTCQNKCPFDNLRWHIPEGGGGPRYHHQ